MADTFFNPDWMARVRRWDGPRCVAAVAVGLAVVALLVWAWRLWPEWRENPDLSHGFLALPIVWLLWRRAREQASDTRHLPDGAALAGATVAGFGLLGALLFVTVYAVALGWGATPTLFLLSAGLAAALALVGLLAASRSVRWIAPGWPLLVLLATVVLSAPLPPGSYARLSTGLQEAITIGVVETLRFFGIPALRAGNVINLGHTSVGVEEACSGVRSLVSCVLAGLVLSALLVRSPWRRLVLVAASAPLALVTNFIRSLTLTLLARNGVDIAGAWHDGLGFAVLGVTTALLGALAFRLEEAPLAAAGGRTIARESDAATGGWRTALVVLVVLTFGAGWLGYVVARTERPVPVAGEVPELARLIPAAPVEGWAVATRGDLGRFASILQTEHLLERVYSKTGDDGGLVQVTVYAAWWPAGAASVSTVAAHTPEACWPGAGWVSVPATDGRRALPLADGRQAAEAEQRSFRNRDYPQTVWFWHLVAGEPLRPFEPRSWREQLRLFFKNGVRRDQSQAFVRLSSNRDWAELAGEPLIQEVLQGFAELGVPVN